MTYDNHEITTTFTDLTAQYPGCAIWTCQAGHTANGAVVLDALVYRTADNMYADDDNTRVIARALVLA